jgi:hypothetical protein
MGRVDGRAGWDLARSACWLPGLRLCGGFGPLHPNRDPNPAGMPQRVQSQERYLRAGMCWCVADKPGDVPDGFSGLQQRLSAGTFELCSLWHGILGLRPVGCRKPCELSERCQKRQCRAGLSARGPGALCCVPGWVEQLHRRLHPVRYSRSSTQRKRVFPSSGHTDVTRASRWPARPDGRKAQLN